MIHAYIYTQVPIRSNGNFRSVDGKDRDTENASEIPVETIGNFSCGEGTGRGKVLVTSGRDRNVAENPIRWDGVAPGC